MRIKLILIINIFSKNQIEFFKSTNKFGILKKRKILSIISDFNKKLFVYFFNSFFLM
jgi:hypothetical protein